MTPIAILDIGYQLYTMSMPQPTDDIISYIISLSYIQEAPEDLRYTVNLPCSEGGDIDQVNFSASSDRGLGIRLYLS